MRASRQEVYAAIDSERDYQGPAHADYHERCGTTDADWSIGDWLHFVEWYLEKAKKEFCYGTGLSQIRKIAALCVACMEHHGAATRE